MNQQSVRQEIFDSYKNESKQSLNFLIVLTYALRTIHSKAFTFLALLIFVIPVMWYYYNKTNNYAMIICSIIVHSVVYILMINFDAERAENYSECTEQLKALRELKDNSI